MFDGKGRFVIEQYQKQSAFASFLPGIGGKFGIPVWSFYVNRGQAITSFGVENKDHSIMEFCPAHEAYQVTEIKGFRTFLKVNGTYYEPFRTKSDAAKMYIGMNELEIEEENKELGIKVKVLYYTLPGENLGGLVRTVQIENLGDQVLEVEMLDGLPAVIPYGIELDDIKKMGQTMMAWMQAEDVDQGRPYYRVRYSTKDSARVQKIEKGNFVLARSEEGETLPVIADPELIFQYDTAFERPVGFLETPLKELCKGRQNLQNLVPCGFACREFRLKEKASRTSYMMIGQAENKELLKRYAKRCLDEKYFAEKRKEACQEVHHLTEAVRTKTADSVFDAYCEQTCLDNLLRGGYPVKVGKDGVFYIYSRKHGDLERDYNYFTMLPEFYSQGNGNYRDVNQNRRNDILFAPWIKDYNIKLFYNLIQLDGYNPLVVKQVTYRIENETPALEKIPAECKEKFCAFLQQPFSPGQLFTYMEQNQINLTCGKQEFLDLIVENSRQELNADFSEGYWVDHWTYNLDLIESYLKLYPEREEDLLFLDQTYTYYQSEAVVLPRNQRYERTGEGVRQYHSIQKKEKKTSCGMVCDCAGSIYTSNLMTKLIVIAANKFASLDMYGMGIEMEAGKPGWYDALNGMPAIFGSSMSETYELDRLLAFMISAIDRYRKDVVVPEELYEFIRKIRKTVEEYFSGKAEVLQVWNSLNEAKEFYREQTADSIKGEMMVIGYPDALSVLRLCKRYTEEGIGRAVSMGDGVPPTYFTYHFTDFKTVGTSLMPENPKVEELPKFLEGSVHYMKLLSGKEERKALYDQVKHSGLYDTELGMYKVNSSLKNLSFEAGRAVAFSSGWLENESIWLHMEYKYLLELLKAELYEEFFKEFLKAAIPFRDYQDYGRSPLENSSFLVSSANKNRRLWGRGFVARLSGATAEFLEIWNVMMFGKHPFWVSDGKLICSPEPSIPEYLIPEDKVVEGMFLGKTKVTYCFDRRMNMFPGRYEIEKMELTFRGGQKISIQGKLLEEKEALRLRDGEVENLKIWCCSKNR